MYDLSFIHLYIDGILYNLPKKYDKFIYIFNIHDMF